MATTSKRSLVQRAGSAARKAVKRGTTRGAAAAEDPAPAKKTEPAKKSAPATKSSTKKSTPTKKSASAKKSATAEKSSTAKKAPATKKSAPATKSSTKKSTATKKSAPAKKSSTAKKTPAEKTTATKKTATKKTARTPSTSGTTSRAATKATPPTVTQTPATQASTAGGASKQAAKQTTKKTAKKTATTKSAATATDGVAPGSLVVLEQEDPWTASELAEVRTTLLADRDRLVAELADVESDLAGMIASGTDGSGNDQADVGSASFERDQEMVIVNNAREMLQQTDHALERIANGTYGVCEQNGEPIGKRRLMAFPRATMCMTCKQREERR